MKKLMSFLILAAIVISPVAFAEDMAKSMPMQDHSQMMKVHQCSMDGYTSEKAGKCPKCGMDLEEKELPADEAKAALEASKESK